jgi:hypothetical protein
VVGRVDLERDERPDLADRHGVEPRAEHLGVLEHVPDLGVATDDDHPDVVAHVDGGAGVAQEVEQGLRVGERLGIGLAPHQA